MPPFRSDFAPLLRLRRNPFWKRADGALFLARRGQDPVGRIGVHVDRAEGARGDRGLFGWLEMTDDPSVCAALFEAARSWATDEGVTELAGPASYTALEQAGLLVEGHDAAATHLAGWHPPYYRAAVEAMANDAAADSVVRRVTLSSPTRADAHAVADPPLRTLGAAARDLTGSVMDEWVGHPAAWAPTVAEVGARLRRLGPTVDRGASWAGEDGVAVVVRDLGAVLSRLREGGGASGAAATLRAARAPGGTATVALLAGRDRAVVAETAMARAARAGYEAIEAIEPAVATAFAAASGGRAAVVRRYRTYRVKV